MYDEEGLGVFLFFLALIIAAFLLAPLLTSCGAYDRRACYEAGEECRATPPPDSSRDSSVVPNGCTVKRIPAPEPDASDEVRVSCPDGSSANVRSGRNGAPGTTGALGPVGTAGATGATGSRGETGVAGTQGPLGPAGPGGPQGPAGIPGTPGTGVNAVKLCADSTSSFPEYGLQIGDSLYAVYWGALNGSSEQQAFLAKLVPGAYQSTNGTGCLFTVNDDGSITR